MILMKWCNGVIVMVYWCKCSITPLHLYTITPVHRYTSRGLTRLSLVSLAPICVSRRKRSSVQNSPPQRSSSWRDQCHNPYTSHPSFLQARGGQPARFEEFKLIAKPRETALKLACPPLLPALPPSMWPVATSHPVLLPPCHPLTSRPANASRSEKTASVFLLERLGGNLELTTPSY